MDKETAIALFAFLSAAGGGVRWLLHVYIKQNEKLEDIRHRNERSTISMIKDSVSELQKDLDVYRHNLKHVEDLLKIYVKRADTNIEDNAKAIHQMQVFIDSTIKRMRDLESRIIELANGLMMFKGSKHDPKRSS